MHTLDILDQAVRLAEELGYYIRRDWLDGTSGGLCEIAGKPWIFIDLSLSPLDQLEQILSVLRNDPAMQQRALPDALGAMLPKRRAA